MGLVPRELGFWAAVHRPGAALKAVGTDALLAEDPAKVTLDEISVVRTFGLTQVSAMMFLAILIFDLFEYGKIFQYCFKYFSFASNN